MARSIDSGGRRRPHLYATIERTIAAWDAHHKGLEASLSSDPSALPTKPVVAEFAVLAFVMLALTLAMRASFTALVFAVVAIGIAFTARVTCARPRVISRYGRSLALKGTAGAVIAAVTFAAQGRVPPLLARASNCAIFALSYTAGLAFPFAAVALPCLAESVRLTDRVTAGTVAKVAVIVLLLLAHVTWALRAGARGIFGLCVLAAEALAIAFVTWVVRRRYYLHLHHWSLAALLLPACANDIDALTVALAAFTLAQFVEGAARWCTAPPWHRRLTAPALITVAPTSPRPMRRSPRAQSVPRR